MEYDGTHVEIENPFQISRKLNNFVFKSFSAINIGYDPSCHVHVRKQQDFIFLLSKNIYNNFQCDARDIPVENTPCSGVGCVVVVRWELDSVLQNNNTLTIL